MKRIRFSLLAFFVFLTLCGVCCGAGKYVAIKQEVVAPTGSGTFYHLGWISFGMVDWSKDDRGTLVGVWREHNPGNSAVIEQRPLLVIEVGPRLD